MMENAFTCILCFLILLFQVNTQVCSIKGGNVDLQNAITTCCKQTSNRPLTIELQGDVTSPPILLSDKSCDGVLINLAGHTISAPADKSAWGGIPTAYFTLKGLTKVSVGNGTIDGSGKAWWCNSTSPNLLMNVMCDGVTFHSLKLQNPPKFHLVPSGSHNTVIDHITIHAPYTKTSCNLDGIDPSNCDGVVIKDCDIHSGDDDVAIKPGTTNALIENCVFRTGHGASIGSINHGNTGNITFRNITFNVASDGAFENGARIKTVDGGTGEVFDIVFDTFTMSDVPNPLTVVTNYPYKEDFDRDFDLEYQTDYAVDSLLRGEVADGAVHIVKRMIRQRDIMRKARFRAGGVNIKGVTFKNFRVTNTPKARPPAITCSTASPCSNFVFENLVFDSDITCTEVSGKYGNPPFQPPSFKTCLKPEKIPK